MAKTISLNVLIREAEEAANNNADNV